MRSLLWWVPPILLKALGVRAKVLRMLQKPAWSGVSASVHSSHSHCSHPSPTSHPTPCWSLFPRTCSPHFLFTYFLCLKHLFPQSQMTFSLFLFWFLNCLLTGRSSSTTQYKTILLFNFSSYYHILVSITWHILCFYWSTVEHPSLETEQQLSLLQSVLIPTLNNLAA